MRLAAVYCVWDDWDLLRYSLKNIEPLVDGVIIVGSTKSNYGEYSPIPDDFLGRVAIREPQFKTPRENETDKRNFGLDLAKWAGFTHFLSMDADEFYDPEEFLSCKKYFDDELPYGRTIGLVVRCQTYFKSPKLTIGLDVTRVPFIHEIAPTLKHVFNKDYPFAWQGKQICIDPTRSLNINDSVILLPFPMHHMSWVRKDYQKKIRNSTAKTNLERSCILKDLLHAKEGYFCQYYQKTLVRASVDFNIPEYGLSESGDAALCQNL